MTTTTTYTPRPITLDTLTSVAIDLERNFEKLQAQGLWERRKEYANVYFSPDNYEQGQNANVYVGGCEPLTKEHRRAIYHAAKMQVEFHVRHGTLRGSICDKDEDVQQAWLDMQEEQQNLFRQAIAGLAVQPKASAPAVQVVDGNAKTRDTSKLFGGTGASPKYTEPARAAAPAPATPGDTLDLGAVSEPPQAPEAPPTEAATYSEDEFMKARAKAKARLEHKYIADDLADEAEAWIKSKLPERHLDGFNDDLRSAKKRALRYRDVAMIAMLHWRNVKRNPEGASPVENFTSYPVPNGDKQPGTWTSEMVGSALDILVMLKFTTMVKEADRRNGKCRQYSVTDEPYAVAVFDKWLN